MSSSRTALGTKLYGSLVSLKDISHNKLYALNSKKAADQPYFSTKTIKTQQGRRVSPESHFNVDKAFKKIEAQRNSTNLLIE